MGLADWTHSAMLGASNVWRRPPTPPEPLEFGQEHHMTRVKIALRRGAGWPLSVGLEQSERGTEVIVTIQHDALEVAFASETTPESLRKLADQLNEWADLAEQELMLKKMAKE